MRSVEDISKHILLNTKYKRLFSLDEMCHPPWTWSPIRNGRFECDNVIETGALFNNFTNIFFVHMFF